MKIILVLVLSLLVSCTATTTSETDFKLTDNHVKCTMALKAQKLINNKLQEEIKKWKLTDSELATAKEAENSLTELLSKSIKDFAQSLSDSSEEQVKVKADEISFIDDYNGALVRIWVIFPDELAKFYVTFTRSENGEWIYKGYALIGVRSTGVR
jgi:hypothetical protein